MAVHAQEARSQIDAARVLGARPIVEQASLSPDGKRMAYLEPIKGQGSVLMIVDLEAAVQVPKAIFRANGEPNRLGSCNWTGNTRLLCDLYASTMVEGSATYITRLVAVDADGGPTKMLDVRRGRGESLQYALYGGSVIDWNPSEDGHVLMVRPYIPEVDLGTRLGQTDEGLGVDLVDTRKLTAKVVEGPNKDASEFISDGYGKVRIKGHSVTRSEYLTPERRYYYRKPESNAWHLLSVVAEESNGFDPYAVDRNLNVAFGLKRLNGRLAAYRVALDGSGKEDLVFEHPEVDVAGFVRIGRRDRVIGVRYVTDVAQVHYIDQDIAKMTAALSRAIPDLPLIRVIDSSEDERKMLVWAGSDTDPGRYFLFDRDAKTLGNMLSARPELENVTLGTMKAMTYPARDGTQIPGYLTLPPGKTDAAGLPAIVMPHGGPGARDEWGFDWLVQYFALRGYAVLQPNFRGSAGYGIDWFKRNGFQNWQIAIGDVNDAGRWLVQQGADANRLAIFGWSYGGYAALQSNVVEPDLFKAVVAVAPVTDLERLKEDRRGWTDYRLVSGFVGSGPHIKDGSPARNAEVIRAPVLMFHGDIDRNVDVGHAKLMDSRLKSAGKSSELHVYKDRDHYLEDGDIRAEMLRTSAAFMEKAFAGN
ncbi:alpha/beta hydrolase family protein [Blastomonas sp.]|uniref:alpha/beta hydrolase family protein n=1 Tax=Blastomonas sp. TaxID=1909299 RepID=UPI003593D343